MTRRPLAAVPDQPKRVVLYVRVSAVMGRGGEDFHSPDVQVNAMQRVTAGMKVVAVIDDDIDQTGRTFDREGIARIRQLAEAKAIDAMAVYNISRFGRNVLESLQFLSWLADRGVTILSATEHIDTSTPSGRWMLTNMLAIAEMRSDEIAAEWSRTIGHRTAAGKHHGRAPAGYLRGDDGRLRPDPVTAPAVTRAFAQYADGVQVREIRRQVQAATGLSLAPTTVKRMLANVTYLGTAHSRGQTGAVEKPGAHEPLVDEVTWQRVQARMERDRTMPPRAVSPSYALTSLVGCGACHGPLAHKLDKKRDEVRLHCTRRWAALQPSCVGCGHPHVGQVEAAVLERIRGYIANLRGDVGAAAAQAARASRAGIDADAVDAELRATRRAMARATERWARNQLDDGPYEDAMSSLRQAEANLKGQLAKLKDQASRPQAGRLIALGEELLELWGEMDGGQRNRALRELVERVEIKPAARYREPMHLRVEVFWR